MNPLRPFAVAALLVLAAACSSDPPAPGSAASGIPEPATGTPTATAPTATAPPATPGLVAGAALLPSGYFPLWPFGARGEVEAWQRSYKEGGHSPWHLDAAQTALQFASGYLGLPGIDRVTKRSIEPTEAHIGVGYLADSEPSTAAVIHLFRTGTGADSPWVVVGTDDSTLTLTTPRYGARVTSPLKAGGRVSGVDESIQLRLRSLSRDTPLGKSCCLAAGGENRPWSLRLTFTKAAGTLTLVAWTGGHLAEVERFAVTAVHAS